MINNYVRDLEADMKNAKPDRVFITHSQCLPEIVDGVRDYIESLGIFAEINETRAGGIISSHCGHGILGFCMAFNMKKNHIVIPTIGGIICWASYLLIQYSIEMVFVSTMLSAIIIGIYGNVFAKINKVPTTILYIPAYVPLIPGGNLYHMALAMISSDWNQFMNNLMLLALYSFGISIGLAVVGEFEKMKMKINAIRRDSSRI